MTLMAALALALTFGPVQEQVRLESVEHGVPYLAAVTIILMESRWNLEAMNVNPDGSRDWGLMQLNDRYFTDGGDWKVNVHVGVVLLASLKAEAGTWYWAFYAYNAGIGSFRRGAPSAAARDYATRACCLMGQLEVLRHLRDGNVRLNW